MHPSFPNLRFCHLISACNNTDFKSQSQNLSAHVAELNNAVASMFVRLEALSRNAPASSDPPHASVAFMLPAFSRSKQLEVIEKGKLFRACVTSKVSELTSQFQVSLSQEPQNQMRLAVERRLRLSEVSQRCGGSSNFIASAAATVDDYIKWASAEINKDDGRASKVQHHHYSVIFLAIAAA